MPRLIVTETAVDGLERCRRFLTEKNAEAVRKAALVIERQLHLLETNPELGRIFPASPELRELTIPFGDAGYVALYRFDPAQDSIYVLAFRHQREAGY